MGFVTCIVFLFQEVFLRIYGSFHIATIVKSIVRTVMNAALCLLIELDVFEKLLSISKL